MNSRMIGLVTLSWAISSGGTTTNTYFCAERDVDDEHTELSIVDLHAPRLLISMLNDFEWGPCKRFTAGSARVCRVGSAIFSVHRTTK